ncbi:glycosyltransferase [Jannaschia sp. W003]|uniref:glycosyltransferase n=1 Tax=Jannaschia sp. W003 TaxID=2867012 RepID=UPI0021A503F5|nr:glycosyltransferase [Jannaschia sp. W003]UWQ23217.1 glycosyltransferase [Jannaschia sp. W003]
MRDNAPTGAVAIGRNEGARLLRCLRALRAQIDGPVIYVDSGSTDGSVAAARELGAAVVELPPDTPFTAALARNAGLARLMEENAPPHLVQFVDGDCEIVEGWLPAARAFLAAHEDVAVVCGRRRERHPEASVWNRMIDREWDTPVGEARACGGDALMRVRALRDVGGFDERLIAGEEPELCVRLRAAGWRVWRLDAEMTLHDAAMTRASQWWRRTARAGHAFAEGAAMHGRRPERHNVDRLRRALLWGLGLPLAALAGTLVTPWALLLLLLYPAQILRLAPREGLARAATLTLGKVAEAHGALTWAVRRLRGAKGGLIEYK